MAKKLFYVTTTEMVRVTRGYTAEDETEAVKKMTGWVKAREDEGREFSRTFLVESYQLK